MVELKRDGFYNSRLGMNLSGIRPECIWNLDEKPLMPDFVKGHFTADGVLVPRTSGTRSASWSILFWLSASGDTIPPLCIFPEEVKARTAEITDTICRSRTPIRTAFEPNGYMNGKTFENELYEALPLLRQKMLPHENGLLIFDNHVSHISRKVVSIARWFGFHVLTLPSHLSMLVQPLDNHFNLAFQRTYQKLYSNALSQALTSSRAITVPEKVLCVIDAFNHVANTDIEKNMNSFKICGMPAGFPNPQSHLKPKRFAAGTSFRGKEMPKVSAEYLRLLFSPENLAAPLGYILDSDILAKLATKLVSDEAAQRSAQELINLLCSSDNGDTEMAMLQKAGAHFYPNIQKKTTTYLRELYQLNYSQNDATNQTPERSPEVLKVANRQLSLMVGSGMVLTSEAGRNTLEVIEVETEKKKQAAVEKDSHAKEQKHLWLALLAKLIQLKLVPASTELEKDSLPAKVLHSTCTLLTPRVRKDGKKIVVANRLLERFGIEGAITEYSESTPQVAANDDDPTADDE